MSMEEYMQAEKDAISEKEKAKDDAAKEANRQAIEEEIGLSSKKQKKPKLDVHESQVAGDIKDIQKKRFALKNPINMARRSLARRKIQRENHYLRREELMKQDTERYLMELEEQHTWLAYELRARNASRMKKEHELKKVTSNESKYNEEKQIELETQQGLSYFRGEITHYRCWQNSEAKHLDIAGHASSVSSVKMSKCLKYIISASFDKTAKVWSLANGKCLYTFSGHTKKVNDCDVHINFCMDAPDVGVITCSSDATIRYWNCIAPDAIKVVTGHSEAVYRCSFSPDCQRVVSCSEDMTSRVWSVPEGFMLFVFKAHVSPVSTVRFSPSGKFLVSGSDYGERRLMLWNARSPIFKDSIQLPHMIYWSEQGLIKKILFRKSTPDKHFWLSFGQLAELPDDEMVTTWPGENDAGEDFDSESDSGAESNDEEFEEEDDFGKDDIREEAGATVGVTFVNKEGEKCEAFDYIAGGGSLVVSLQSIYEPIAEAFVSVCAKDKQFDSYDAHSGERVGTFKAADPIPWRESFTDPLNLRPPYRMPPKSVTETCQRKAFIYREQRKFDKDSGEEIFDSVAVEMLWTCPPPNTGPVVVTVNFRLRSENFRRKLTYSLKESPIRMNSSGAEDTDDMVDEDGARYLFDQEERHTTFFRFVQDRNWEAVKSFLEKKCFIYFESKRFVRRRKTIEMLQRIFGKQKKEESIVAGVDLSTKSPQTGSAQDETTKHLQDEEAKKRRAEYLHKLSKRPIIVASPVIHKPGQTRSSVMCENLNVWADRKSMFLQDQKEKLEKKKKKQEKLARKAARKAEKQAIRDEKKRLRAKAEAEAEAERVDNNEGIEEAPVHLESTTSEENLNKKVEEGKDSSGEDSSSSGSEESDDSEDSDSDSDASSGDSSSGSSYDTDSSEGSSGSSDGSMLPPIKEVAEEEEGSPSPNKQDPPSTPIITKSASFESNGAISRSSSMKESVPPLSRTMSAKSEAKSDAEDDMSLDSESSKARDTLRDALKTLPSIVYTEPVEGESFFKRVRRIARLEVSKANTFKLLGYPRPNELRHHTTQGHTAKSLLAWGNSPDWVHQQVEEAERKKQARIEELENMEMGAQGVPDDRPDVNDGMFGPRYDGMNMKLPNIYPHKAGLAKNALKQTLKKNEKSQKKEKQRRIPTPEEAVALYEAKKDKKYLSIKKPNFLRAREESKKDAVLLEDEIKLHVLVNSGYPTARRSSLTALPGMAEHYPNPEYHDGALLPAGYKPEKKEKEGKSGILSNLFGGDKRKQDAEISIADPASADITTPEESKGVKMKVVQKFPPAGNKPPSYSTIQQKTATQKGRKSVVGSVDNSLQMSTEESLDLNSLASSITDGGSRRPSTRGQARRESRRNSQELRRDSRRTSRARVSITSQLAHFNAEGTLFASSSPPTTQESNHTRKRNSRMTPLFEGLEGIKEDLHEDLLSSLNLMKQSLGPPEEPAIAPDMDANQHHFNNPENRPPHFPRDVYLGRRGSYMIAPGLESFQAMTRNEEKSDDEKDESDSISSYMRKKAAKNANRMEEFATSKRKIEAPGLICVMNTKGFDVAHQGGINDAVFSPSESRVASCGGDCLIKLWDTRDGSYVRSFKGHKGEVTSVAYTQDEMYLVSSGCDLSIFIWDMALFSVTRILRGHVDVINSIAISNDASFMVSGSYDSVIKTWYLTPRVPEAPLPPKIITKTHSSVMLQWISPPSFNEPITAFFLQYKIPGQEYWSPEEPYTIPPSYRQKTLKGLPPCTSYQYRLKAANRMGESDWGQASKLVTTLMGCPLQLERPEISGITSTSMSIFFFSPNPKLFGAAPHSFQVQWSGSGIEFEDTEYSFSLEDGMANASKLLSQFSFWTSQEGINIKKREKRESSQARGKEAALPTFEVSHESMTATVERSQALENVLVSCTVNGLEYGKLYRIRVAGINDSGLGPWSESSFSTSTFPGLPQPPLAPYRVDRGLTWLRLQWDPPNDGGSAIVGYRIYIKHREYYMDVPRWQVTHELTKLVPGQSYHLKVLAKNVVGWTDYGPYNDDIVGETATAPPDQPNNPLPFDGGWGFVKLKSQIPFGNGRPPTHVFCQLRTVQPFSKGQWSKDYKFDLNDPTQISYVKEKETAENLSDTDHSDSDSDEDYSGMTVQEIAKLKKKKLLKKSKPARKVKHKVATGKLELTRQETGVEWDFEKKPGRTISFRIDDLTASTQYQFRVCYANETGRSEYSIPSQRCKTNPATVPDPCKTPKCIDMMHNYLIVGFQLPCDGGNDIISFMIKVEGMDKDPDTGETTTQHLRVLPHFTQHKIEGLKPGGAYRVCIRADNDVGEGSWSPWTKVFILPKEKRKEKQDNS